MSRLPVPLLGFPNERLYGHGLLEIKHGPKTFFVGQAFSYEGKYVVFVQPDQQSFYYDSLLLVYTHIHNAIEEMKDAEHREADTVTGENVERHP